MARAGTIVITGASGNLGRAVADRLGADGHHLVLVARDRRKLDEAFPDSDAARRKIAVDLTDREATAHALLADAEQFGPADALCAIAGGFHMGEPVHATPDEVWRRMQAQNVATLLNAVQATVPGMVARGGGRIVTIGAQAAHKGAAMMGAYCAAKSSVMRISKSMAAELAPQGIRVNCVLPSIIDTPQNRAAMPKADPRAWTSPVDIAATIAFLVSDEAAAINGAMIPV